MKGILNHGAVVLFPKRRDIGHVQQGFGPRMTNQDFGHFGQKQHHGQHQQGLHKKRQRRQGAQDHR